MTHHEHTGASNIEFDLISELHNLLDGNAALEQYISDAGNMGDGDAENCFRRLHDQNLQAINELKGLLAKRLQSQGQTMQGQTMGQQSPTMAKGNGPR